MDNPYDLLRGMLQGMGLPAEKINEALVGPALKEGLPGLHVANPPPTPTIPDPYYVAPMVVVEPNYVSHKAELDPNGSVVVAVLEEAAASKPLAKVKAPSVSNGKYSTLKPEKEWDIVEKTAVANDNKPLAAPSSDPLVTPSTPEFEVTYTAKPITVKVRAKSQEEAEQRADSTFDPLGAEWERAK